MGYWDEMAPPCTFGQMLEGSFFERSPLVVAPDLLGCVIASCVGGTLTAGYIVETEAYMGSDDPGSHAATKGITPRNSVMYGPPATAYVYFTYGNHHMLNLVCCREGEAGAVLVRALEPLEGIDAMTSRRMGKPLLQLCDGPGKLAQALGIDLSDNGTTLGIGRLAVYAGRRSSTGEAATSGRVGLSSGHELEYRFFEQGNPFISRGRTGPLRAPARTRVKREGRVR